MLTKDDVVDEVLGVIALLELLDEDELETVVDTEELESELADSLVAALALDVLRLDVLEEVLEEVLEDESPPPHPLTIIINKLHPINSNKLHLNPIVIPQVFIPIPPGSSRLVAPNHPLSCRGRA